MIAPTPDQPDDEQDVSSSGVFLLGSILVPPCYLLIAWALVRWLGDEPVGPAEHRFLVFGVLCAVSLALAVTSFWAKQRWRSRRWKRLNNMETGTLVAMAMAEGPAFIGLVYHAVYRHWTGFILFLVLSATTFISHALPRRIEASTPDRFS